MCVCSTLNASLFGCWQVNDLTGVKESDTGLAPPSQWDLRADQQAMQEEQPLQVRHSGAVAWPSCACFRRRLSVFSTLSVPSSDTVRSLARCACLMFCGRSVAVACATRTAHSCTARQRSRRQPARLLTANRPLPMHPCRAGRPLHEDHQPEHGGCEVRHQREADCKVRGGARRQSVTDRYRGAQRTPGRFALAPPLGQLPNLPSDARVI